MILRNIRINNEFYTAPAYNYSVKNGLTIGIRLVYNGVVMTNKEKILELIERQGKVRIIRNLTGLTK